MTSGGTGTVLAVYVVWHPLYERGAELADSMFRSLCGDPSLPAVRGLGIPVRFRTSESSDTRPGPISFESAQHSAVFVLIDDEMVAAGWDDYLEELASSATNGHLLVPVALTRNALNINPKLSSLQFARVYDVEMSEVETVLLNRVMHDLCCLLRSDSSKVQVFISHSKRDGLEIARDVRRHLHEQTSLGDFFDATDIPDGTRFAEIIGAAVGSSSVLLVIHTDSYGSREWCRLEVLEAKRRRIPIVVLAAVERGEVRSFPYLGNLPVIRWGAGSDASIEHIVTALLREVLRGRYFPLRVEAIRGLLGLQSGGAAHVYPPELLTALLVRVEKGEKPSGMYLYPDPPLGNEELQLLSDLDPTLEPITLTMLIARE